MIEGGGTIDSETGIYTAPYGEGTAIVRVTDEKENTTLNQNYSEAIITYGLFWTWQTGSNSFDEHYENNTI